jgi:S1-C subfamily serine protease
MDMNDAQPPSGSSEPTEDEPVNPGASAGNPSETLPGYPYGDAHPADWRQPGSAMPLPPPPIQPPGPYGAPQPGVQPTQQVAPVGPPTQPVAPVGPPPPAGTWWTPPASERGPWTPSATGGWDGGPAGPPPPPGSWFHPGFAGPPPPQPATRKSGRRGLVAGIAAAIVAVAVIAGAGVGHVVWTAGATQAPAAAPGITNPGGGSGSTGNGSSPFGSGSSGSSGNSSTGAGAPSDISGIAAKVNPALVDINTNLSYQNEQAAGTGMVLTSDGVILTNNHVIDGATSISVTDIGNGKTYTANVVGYDRTGDIAVIKLVNASGLKTISASSGTAAVGQAIVGIGNAGGAGGTPSAAGGSVTALNQSITASDDGGGNAENLTGLIEINAGIQPGDSGGPLVNTSGQVLGMDTAASSSNGYQVSGSQAYAIPISTALTIAKQIQAGTASSTVHIGATGFLGISVQSSSSSSSGGSNPFGGGSSSGGGSNSASSGATIVSVLPNSAASSAGLAQGDVITALNGTAVNAASDLSNLLVPHHPGDTVQVQWTDQSGQTHTAGVTLATGPPA